MNKWRLLLFSIFALLHITTSERPFIDGRYRCYDHSPRILPSDKSFSAYETNRERQFLPEIRQLNPPDNYPNSNLRDTEIVRLSRRWQIRDIKQHSRDENRQTISPSVPIRDKRDNREQNFVESTSERTNDLRSNLRHNRLDRNRDAEYQRNIRTTSLSRENYRKHYATRTPVENRDVNRYSNIDRDVRYTHDNNRDQTQRQFSDHDELNTQRVTNSDAMRIGFNHVRYTKTYDRYIHEEPDLRNLRTIRSERANDNNKLSNVRNSRLGMQRDLYEDLSQGESSNDQRNNLRSLDRMDSRENKRRFPGDSQTNKRSLVRDIANLNSLYDQKRSARVHNRAVHIERPMGEHRLALHETSLVSRTQRRRSQPFDRVDINGERENRLRTRRSSSEEMYLLRMDQMNTRSQIDRRNGNNNARSTRDTVEKESLANREVRENVGPKMYHINMNSRLQLTEHETVVSRLDRRNRNNNARSTRNINEIDTSDNREVRDDFRHKMNRVNMNTRLEMNERETVLSRLDRRNVNNNARSSRNSNEIEILENREVRETVGPKMNRVNMNSRLEIRERETGLSRLNRRNVNNNARTFRNTNEKEISEIREVRENVGPKMNRVDMNSRLDMREHETVLSRLDRRNVNKNARTFRNTNGIEISVNRDVRENVAPKMNSRMEMRERETAIFRPDRRNANNKDRSTRNINEMEISEKREVRNDSGPKMNRVNMNSRLDMRERETMMSRIERRNVNSSARNTRNINGIEISVNRDVRENVAPKMNRVNMNSRLDMRERETVLSRLDQRNVNNNARTFRNTNEKEISENREVRENVGPKMNRVNINSRLDMRERETVIFRLDRRNANNNARSTRNINEMDTSEKREVKGDFGPKMNPVNMNSRLDMRERETMMSRLERRNVNSNARNTRNINGIEISVNRDVRENVGPKMNSRLEMRERETVIFRPDRRNANNNARSTRNINVMETSEKSEVRDDFGLKMNPVNMNSRLDMRERETMMSRLERRNVNSNARNTRNINGIEISVNRDVRENVGPKMNSRLEMRERETVIFRPDRRNANNNARSTRNINVMETSEKSEVRDDFGLKMNRVNMNTRLEMKKRDIRGTNENMIIIRRRKVVTDLYRDNTITVRRNVPSQEFRVNELRRSERIQRSINDATNTMSRRTREALSLSPENRIRYDARQNLRESQYVRSRENRINVERDERQRSYKHEISTDRIHINNIQRRVQIRASIRQDENRITSRNDRNFVSGIHISRSTTENENRQQSRNVINENQLSNRRHEVRNARDERRQTKMTQVDISIDMRRLATVRYDEDNEKPIPVQKLQYEIHVFEMKWQYLFYALQAVYIFSIIMKMPNSNQENKHTKWISTWFTPTKYLKMD